ncbi:MAG: hypothetical protein QT02_C0009G0010 [archaeon GW2011_AR9]|nr:MAG: hypothetical protein QT02_C0009G0010 [archaeon GW2011_AR9]HIH13186.1 hypothetical protein [Candidatus Woesearchaeota archaeon]
MLVFGIDVPLVEIILVFLLVIFIILAEAIVIVTLMIRQLSKQKRVIELVEKLAETVLSIKKVEIEELDRLKGRR